MVPALKQAIAEPALSGWLLTQTEAADQALVAVAIRLGQIVEELVALADHLEQTAARRVVVAVSLEVLRQLDDAAGEERDLHFGRARVIVGAAVVGDHLSLKRG